MLYKNTTQTPNSLFDNYLAILTEAELKIFLCIVRKTYGWIDKRTGKRKTRDRITHYQFRQKTGLSKRIITKAIQLLVTKSFIEITDVKGGMLRMPAERKGKTHLFYAVSPVHFATGASAQHSPAPVNGSAHNKTNYLKTTGVKLMPKFSGHIATVLAKKKWTHETALAKSP